MPASTQRNRFYQPPEERRQQRFRCVEIRSVKEEQKFARRIGAVPHEVLDIPITLGKQSHRYGNDVGGERGGETQGDAAEEGGGRGGLDRREGMKTVRAETLMVRHAPFGNMGCAQELLSRGYRARTASARVSRAERSVALRRLLRVTMGCTRSMFLKVSSSAAMILPAVGAQVPFSTMATRRF